MMRPPVLVTGPSALPLPLDHFKQRIGDTAGLTDAAITAALETATAKLDGYSGRLGRAIINQAWRQDFDGSLRGFRFRFPDVSAAVVTILDSDGTLQTAPTSSHRILRDAIGWYLAPTAGATWFSVRGEAAISVEYITGFGPLPENVPAPVREAIFLMARALCSHPSGTEVVRSETVEGIGSTGYVNPADVAKVTDDAVRDLIRDYRWRSI